MELKQKTLRGVSWSFVDNFGTRFVQFLVGLVMARILSPREYGLLGILTIFVSFSSILMDSGFSLSLIQKKECTDRDYCTVFYFNVAASLVLYAFLYAVAPWIATFFHEGSLVPLVRVFSLMLLVNATATVQRVILSKKVEFKTQAIISLTASVLSSAIGIVLALRGFGVWSLVVRMLCESAFVSILFWVLGSFRLSLIFDIPAFREMLSFGSKMLASTVIDRGYEEAYKVVIGKFFSVRELGYYTRAIQFSDIPSSGFTNIVQRVSAPVMAQLEPERLKPAYQRLVTTVTFVVFAMMLGMAGAADNIVLVLVGAKWAPVIPYLRLLCLATALYPLHALNLEVIWIRGMSGLFLKLEIAKKIMIVPVIGLGILYGVKAMLGGLVGTSVLSYFIDSHYSGRLINYSTWAQILDLTPLTLVTGGMGIFVYLLGVLLPLGHLPLFFVEIGSGAAFVVVVSELSRLRPYMELKTIALNKLSRRNPA